MDRKQMKDSIQFIFDEHKVVDEASKQRILSKMSPKPRKKKVVWIPAVVTLMLVFGTGMWIATMLPNNEQNAIPVDAEQEDMMETTPELDELKFKIGQFENEVDYYRIAIEQLLPMLSDDEMLQFAQSQFLYELSANHTTIPANGQMEVEAGNVTVLLAFQMPPANILPDEWYERGMISGNYIEHIKQVKPSRWEETYADGANITAQGFQFSNMKSGEQITLTITDELKERLQLQTTTIKIFIK